MTARGLPGNNSPLRAQLCRGDRPLQSQLIAVKQKTLASGAHLDGSDMEAPIVANICRKLDGVALAIELAARRVESYGRSRPPHFSTNV